eukprot:TRINITY_DN11877_c1_g1_i7.p1 TRINITY_DN11877_c1_g1~~TRINITY_DN11877_c1_g1_i7.p1  ORF type:complete len:124 (-),score=8.13 TRINITY_DN11877_c1_g1_i7:202-573(-)
MNRKVSAPYRYWEIAKEVKKKTGTVPIMPNPNRNDDPRMTNYRPLGASSENSSSTVGHANWSLSYRKLAVIERLEYVPLRVDIAIFKAFLMVCLVFAVQLILLVCLDIFASIYKSYQTRDPNP